MDRGDFLPNVGSGRLILDLKEGGLINSLINYLSNSSLLLLIGFPLLLVLL